MEANAESPWLRMGVFAEDPEEAEVEETDPEETSRALKGVASENAWLRSQLKESTDLAALEKAKQRANTIDSRFTKLENLAIDAHGERAGFEARARGVEDTAEIDRTIEAAREDMKTALESDRADFNKELTPDEKKATEDEQAKINPEGRAVLPTQNIVDNLHEQYKDDPVMLRVIDKFVANKPPGYAGIASNLLSEIYGELRTEERESRSADKLGPGSGAGTNGILDDAALESNTQSLLTDPFGEK